MANKDKKLRNMRVAIALITLLVLTFPLLFTQTKVFIADFTNTGQIGDTIGGILSPFIAILVGYLTFEAFRMQYEANELQRIENGNQNIRVIRERFDNRFYTMLETLRSNSRGVECGNYKGKAAFKMLLGELMVTFYAVKRAYKQYEPHATEEVKAYLEEEETDLDKLLTRLAYGLFFYGDLYNVDVEAEPQVFAILDAVKKNIIKNEIQGNPVSYDYFLNAEIKKNEHYKLPWDLMQGHNDQLGHYFRHVFQMAKFLALADSEVITEEDKNEYARIIRAELSDFEQALLFYNAVSDRGDAWNLAIGIEDQNEFSNRGLISRFRLIKNIPGNILYRGVDPWMFYEQDNRWWKSRGKDFFEQCYILTADDEY